MSKNGPYHKMLLIKVVWNEKTFFFKLRQKIGMPKNGSYHKMLIIKVVWNEKNNIFETE